MKRSQEPRLARIAERERAIAGHYRRMTAFVERIGQMSRRPKPGDRAPDFALPSREGRTARLPALLDKGALALVFIRGPWCAYCRAQLRAMADAAPAFADAGIGLAVVTSEIGVESAGMGLDADLPFPLLCDLDGGVALAYGCLIAVPSEERAFLMSRGYDPILTSGAGGWFMPLPSVFGIGADGRVVAVFGQSDPRLRPEPVTVLAQMRAALVQSGD